MTTKRELQARIDALQAEVDALKTRKTEIVLKVDAKRISRDLIEFNRRRGLPPGRLA